MPGLTQGSCSHLSPVDLPQLLLCLEAPVLSLRGVTVPNPAFLDKLLLQPWLGLPDVESTGFPAGKDTCRSSCQCLWHPPESVITSESRSDFSLGLTDGRGENILAGGLGGISTGHGKLVFLFF